jgi:hypothetical protein
MFAVAVLWEASYPDSELDSVELRNLDAELSINESRASSDLCEYASVNDELDAVEILGEFRFRFGEQPRKEHHFLHLVREKFRKCSPDLVLVFSENGYCFGITAEQDGVNVRHIRLQGWV